MSAEVVTDLELAFFLLVPSENTLIFTCTFRSLMQQGYLILSVKCRYVHIVITFSANLQHGIELVEIMLCVLMHRHFGLSLYEEEQSRLVFAIFLK